MFIFRLFINDSFRQVKYIFGCEDAAQQVLMSVLVNQSQAIQSNANEFRLCAFLDFVSKSKLEGYIVMEGTFRLCAFLFCLSSNHITRQYKTVQDSTRQYQTVPDSTRQYKTVQDITRQEINVMQMNT